MRIFTATALTLALLAPTAAFAGGKPSHAELRSAGCTVHHVRVPAGKIVHQTPTVRCPAGVMESLTKKKAIENNQGAAAVN
ncbi:hypothetical protein [Sphingomonas sp. GB1N7]|uniref:hypothetical protein n=1 Tax=Parasphingomonas caseinilytica TaxID=3096158 RepID=UPI002FCACC02